MPEYPRKLVLGLFFIFLYAPFLIANGFQAASSPAIDLPSFHYAAKAAFSDRASPYTEAAAEELQAQLGRKVFPFLYPPPSLLFFAPLAAFSYPSAKILVLAANHLILLALLYLLAFRLLGPEAGVPGVRRSWIGPVLGMFALLFHPVAVTLGHGQINLTVILLLVLFWLGQRQSRPAALTAAPLAAAILLKTYPAIFLLYLALRRSWRTAAWTVGYLAAAGAASWLVLPRRVWTDWWRFVLPTGGYGETPFGSLPPAMPWNQSLNGFAARLFQHPVYAAHPSPLLAKLIPWVGAVLVLGTVLWLVLRLDRARRSPSLDDEIALFLLSMFILAPLSWEHHLVFVLPAALLALQRILAGQVDRGWAWTAGLAVFVMAWPLEFLFEIRSTGPAGLLVSLKLYAVVVLWVYFARRLWRAGLRMST